MIEVAELKEGLVGVRDLVSETHWIQGSYVTVEYLNGDGEYADGAIVKDAKVVGCLVGLARIVGAKWPTFRKRAEVGDENMPAPSPLSDRLESAIKETILDEFFGEEFMHWADRDEDEEDVDEELNPSIELWNDREVRTREQVIAMLDRAIERVS